MAIRYVSTTGNNGNAGTISSPWLTISYGVSQLAPGDTLYIRGGLYNGIENTISDLAYTVPSGSVGNSIVISGYPAETVAIYCPDGSNALHLREADHSYLVFRDLIFDGKNLTADDVATVTADNSHPQIHLLFERCIFRNAWKLGMLHGPADLHVTASNAILQCEFYNNGRGPDGAIAGNTAYGLYAVMSGCFIEYCSFHDNHGWGLQMAGDDNVVHHSTFFNNGLINGDGQTLGSVHGMVCGVGTYGTSTGNIIHDNLFYANRGGLMIYTHAIDTGVYHNTIYGNTNNAVDVQYIDGDVTFQNNILFGNGEDDFHDYGGGSGSILQDHNLKTDPDFVDGPNFDFHLLSTSDAIGAGTYILVAPTDFDDVPRPGLPDIGAFQYQGAISPFAVEFPVALDESLGQPIAQPVALTFAVRQPFEFPEPVD